MQIDQRVFDADPVQWLAAGTVSGCGYEPGLVGLDVVSLEVGTTGHLGVPKREPRTELAQIVLDVLDGRGPQAERDLGHIAASYVGIRWCDRRPAGDGHRCVPGGMTVC